MTVEALAATAVAPVFPSAPASAPIPISAAAASQIFFPSEVAVPQAVSGSAAAAAAQFARHHQSHFQSAVSGASPLAADVSVPHRLGPDWCSERGLFK